MCDAKPGTDAQSAAALCSALQAEGSDRAVRLTVLSTGPASLSASLELAGPQGSRPELPLSFTIGDRDLSPADYSIFARDLLQHRLPD